MSDTTYFLLIRHGMCDPVGHKISGRLPHVYLNDEGQKQASLLAQGLSHFPIRAIYSSPLERTRSTADPLARQLDLPIHVSDNWNEINYGDWSGKYFEELKNDSHWSYYNSFRSGISIPNGELMIEVQSRIVRELEVLRLKHPNQMVAIFTHCDVIRAALCHYLGTPLENILRFEIRTASVSELHLNSYGPLVVRLNDTSLRSE